LINDTEVSRLHTINKILDKLLDEIYMYYDNDPDECYRYSTMKSFLKEIIDSYEEAEVPEQVRGDAVQLLKEEESKL